MLSNKYMAIKRGMTRISKIKPVHQKLVTIAQMYVDIDKGFRFSYMPDENGEIQFLDTLRKIRKGKLVYFDIGSQIDTYTNMIIERFNDYQGHLFDSQKDSYEKCLTRHGTNKKLTINNVALSDTNKAVLDDQHETQRWTGDEYCAKHNIEHINLLKISADGHDLHILRGFDHMLSAHKIDILQFEYSVKHSQTHSMLGDFYSILDGAGYITGPIRQEGVKFEEFEFQKNDFKNGPNYVSCRPEFRNLLSKFK